MFLFLSLYFVASFLLSPLAEAVALSFIKPGFPIPLNNRELPLESRKMRSSSLFNMSLKLSSSSIFISLALSILRLSMSESTSSIISFGGVRCMCSSVGVYAGASDLPNEPLASFSLGRRLAEAL